MISVKKQYTIFSLFLKLYINTLFQISMNVTNLTIVPSYAITQWDLTTVTVIKDIN